MRSPVVRVFMGLDRGHRWKRAIKKGFKTAKKNYRGNGIEDMGKITLPTKLRFYVPI